MITCVWDAGEGDSRRRDGRRSRNAVGFAMDPTDGGAGSGSAIQGRSAAWAVLRWMIKAMLCPAHSSLAEGNMRATAAFFVN